MSYKHLVSHLITSFQFFFSLPLLLLHSKISILSYLCKGTRILHFLMLSTYLCLTFLTLSFTSIASTFFVITSFLIKTSTTTTFGLASSRSINIASHTTPPVWPLYIKLFPNLQGSSYHITSHAFLQILSFYHYTVSNVHTDIPFSSYDWAAPFFLMSN